MLGERRSNSLFAPTAPAEPERKPEQAEVHDISFEERTGRSLFAENATAPRASELFFAPQEKGITFTEALSQVQGYLSETYATLITEDNSDAKEQMKRRMARYLQENRIAVDGMTASELVDALYTEMAEYGFLTKYIFADGIEEIDINSWRDIEIQYSDGHTAKLEEHFDSPEHAANVIRHCRTRLVCGNVCVQDYFACAWEKCRMVRRCKRIGLHRTCGVFVDLLFQKWRNKIPLLSEKSEGASSK